MNLCPKCSVQVIPGAKFCHSCGDKIVERNKPCPVCSGTNPLSSVFCHHCGFHFSGKAKQEYQPRFPINFNDPDLAEQIKALFFSSLRARIAEEHEVHRYSDFVERFYQSRFRDIYEVRALQIAQDLLTYYNRFGTNGLAEIDRRIGLNFEGLMDYFIIQYCPDLSGFTLPAAILKHEQAAPGKTNLAELIMDYLDLDKNQELVHTNFLNMPSEHLANACQRFLHANRLEKVMFILDLSVKGNCKEGIAMTDQGIYWKMPFEKPKTVKYTELTEIQKEKEWLLINGQFFTATQAFNLKLYKVLKKLQGWKEPVATR